MSNLNRMVFSQFLMICSICKEKILGEDAFYSQCIVCYTVICSKRYQGSLCDNHFKDLDQKAQVDIIQLKNQRKLIENRKFEIILLLGTILIGLFIIIIFSEIPTIQSWIKMTSIILFVIIPIFLCPSSIFIKEIMAQKFKKQMDYIVEKNYQKEKLREKRICPTCGTEYPRESIKCEICNKKWND